MKKLAWYFISFIVIVCDQISKMWILHTITQYQPKRIFPFLNLVLAYNSGSAFSFLSGAGDWHHVFFTIFSSLMSLILVIWIWRTPAIARLQLIALTLILGGAVGNLIDRLHFGYVIDFIDAYFHTFHYPAFNIADSAICVGALMLFIDMRKKGALK